MPHETDWPSTQISLLARIREPKDHDAWDRFVDLYAPLIYRFCLKRGLQDADARDITQNVFAQVGQRIRRFDYDPARGLFRGWLGKLTRNEIVDYSNRLGQSVSEQQYTDAGEAIDQTEGTVDAAWIDEFNAYIYNCALARIRSEFTPECWRAFEMVWIEDRPAPEVAAELNKKPEWIYKNKFNILKRLKTEILFLASDAAVLSS